MPWTVLISSPARRDATAKLCPYGIIRTNRKTLAVQGVNWFVLVLFPPNPLQKIGATREAKKRGVT